MFCSFLCVSCRKPLLYATARQALPLTKKALSGKKWRWKRYLPIYIKRLTSLIDISRKAETLHCTGSALDFGAFFFFPLRDNIRSSFPFSGWNSVYKVFFPQEKSSCLGSFHISKTASKSLHKIL